MALTPRENGLNIINWGKPEYVPMTSELYHYCRQATNMIDQPLTGGVDPFGVYWVDTPEGSIPEPDKFMFDDIEDWRKYVVIPDPDKIDFKQCAQIDLEHADRSSKLINVNSTTGLFERLTSLMGFENALCALLENPEECRAIFSALADYKVKCMEHIIEEYKPDVITYFDDLATARGMFMSPDTYRSIIKPYHKKIVDSVNSKGVIFAQHCCGRCEDILQDFVDIGAKIWSSAQIINDIKKIKEDFKGRLVIEGGWDTSGPCSYIGGTVEMAIAEAKRAISEYGPNGGYIMQPILLNERGNSLRVGDPRLTEIIRIWPEISRIY